MSTRRLFYALWLPPAVASALHRRAVALTAQGGGRPMRAETLHLTLAFLGDVDAARVDQLAAIGQRVAAGAAAFPLHLDRHGHWAHNRIDWVGCATVPPTLVALVADLRAALAAAGFPVEARPFVPHVTIVRKRTSGALPDAPPAHCLQVGELCLVESLRGAEGARYVDLGRWPFVAR